MVKQRTPSVRGRIGRGIGLSQRASHCLIANPTGSLKKVVGFFCEKVTNSSKIKNFRGLSFSIGENEHISTLRPAYMVFGYMVFPAILSIFGWSRTELAFIQ